LFNYMIRVGFSIAFFLVVLPSFSQTIELILGRHLHEYIGFEERIGSEIMEYDTKYMLAPSLAQPIIFSRSTDEFLIKPIVKYYFTKEDSIVQQIFYEWDAVNSIENYLTYHEGDLLDESSLDAFVQKYHELKSEVVNILGEGTSTGKTIKNQRLELLSSNLKDNWTTDSISIEMYVTFSNVFEEKGNGKVMPTHRIRVQVRSKDYQELDLSSAFKEIFKMDDKQGEVAEEFMDLLIKGKYKASWKLVSPQIQSKISYSVYLKEVQVVEQLKKQYGDEVELAVRGPNFTQEGVVFMYSFKFKDDEFSPPRILMDVYFKMGENRVYGFRSKFRGEKIE
jgi:hypothetical protein